MGWGEEQGGLRGGLIGRKFDVKKILPWHRKGMVFVRTHAERPVLRGGVTEKGPVICYKADTVTGGTFKRGKGDYC